MLIVSYHNWKPCCELWLNQVTVFRRDKRSNRAADVRIICMNSIVDWRDPRILSKYPLVRRYRDNKNWIDFSCWSAIIDLLAKLLTIKSQSNALTMYLWIHVTMVATIILLLLFVAVVVVLVYLRGKIHFIYMVLNDRVFLCSIAFAGVGCVKQWFCCVIKVIDKK